MNAAHVQSVLIMLAMIGNQFVQSVQINHAISANYA